MTILRSALLIIFVPIIVVFFGALPAESQEQPPDIPSLIETAIDQLIKMEEPGGQWPYEGVYRVGGEIPIGYRIGGTSIVGMALLYGAPQEKKEAQLALDHATAFVIKELNHPLMKPSARNAYDVRIWGHIFSLTFFCHLRARGRTGKYQAEIEKWIPKLIKAIEVEEIPGGGSRGISNKEQGISKFLYNKI